MGSNSETSVAEVSPPRLSKSQTLCPSQSPGDDGTLQHLSHITCPLIKPDGASETETSLNVSESTSKSTSNHMIPSSLDSSVHQVPQASPPGSSLHRDKPSPNKLTADKYAPDSVASNHMTPGHDPMLSNQNQSSTSEGCMTKSRGQSTVSRSTNSDSYDFDDYMPPPVGCGVTPHSWKAGPVEGHVTTDR